MVEFFGFQASFFARSDSGGGSSRELRRLLVHRGWHAPVMESPRAYGDRALSPEVRVPGAWIRKELADKLGTLKLHLPRLLRRLQDPYGAHSTTWRVYLST